MDYSRIKIFYLFFSFALQYSQRHSLYYYSKMQDLTAECLNMERGISGSKGRLEAIQFKIQQKEEDPAFLSSGKIDA